MIQNVTPGTLDLDTIRQVVREEIQLAMKKDPAARKACFIASKGTLDWAYPPLILSTAAAAAAWSHPSSSRFTASTSSGKTSMPGCASRR